MESHKYLFAILVSIVSANEKPLTEKVRVSYFPIEGFGLQGPLNAWTLLCSNVTVLPLDKK